MNFDAVITPRFEDVGNVIDRAVEEDRWYGESSGVSFVRDRYHVCGEPTTCLDSLGAATDIVDLICQRTSAAISSTYCIYETPSLFKFSWLPYPIAARHQGPRPLFCISAANSETDVTSLNPEGKAEPVILLADGLATQW